MNDKADKLKRISTPIVMTIAFAAVATLFALVAIPVAIAVAVGALFLTAASLIKVSAPQPQLIKVRIDEQSELIRRRKQNSHW